MGASEEKIKGRVLGETIPSAIDDPAWSFVWTTSSYGGGRPHTTLFLCAYDPCMNKNHTNNPRTNYARALILGSLLSSGAAFAQITDTQSATTITTVGTISSLDPNTITVRTESSSDPLRYTYNKTTTYVDENGAPVPMETVISGAPVTVYYIKNGDNMVASKVIVRKIVAVPATTPVMIVAPTPPVTVVAPVTPGCVKIFL